ncbi:unnamed protein product [Fraxinus pennsylvanica]|uniref:S5 DRBM domain-containing protein n=1 Tax=Fraxinus pennsylvanica TaxID=56036 RepID=A0AAD1YVP3_9LAMI|nr:unnamed protein product [Fraxinus pennsylvanica]
MNGTDADIIEADAIAPPPQPHPLGLSADFKGDVRNFLSMARQLIDQGKPSQALQAVVMAMRIRGGDGAVFQTFSRARELYRNKVQDSAAADELSALFAECAIVEALPPQFESCQHPMVGQSIEPHVDGTSILAETGRKQVVLDAFSDGSSFVCLQCGGLVSNHCKEAFVVVGDGNGNGNVGLDVKCLKEVTTAIRGSIISAELSVILVRRGYWGNNIGKPHTIPCKTSSPPLEMELNLQQRKNSSSKMMLKREEIRAGLGLHSGSGFLPPHLSDPTPSPAISETFG